MINDIMWSNNFKSLPISVNSSDRFIQTNAKKRHHLVGDLFTKNNRL